MFVRDWQSTTIVLCKKANDKTRSIYDFFVFIRRWFYTKIDVYYLSDNARSPDCDTPIEVEDSYQTWRNVRLKERLVNVGLSPPLLGNLRRSECGKFGTVVTEAKASKSMRSLCDWKAPHLVALTFDIMFLPGIELLDKLKGFVLLSMYQLFTNLVVSLA